MQQLSKIGKHPFQFAIIWTFHKMCVRELLIRVDVTSPYNMKKIKKFIEENGNWYYKFWTHSIFPLLSMTHNPPVRAQLLDSVYVCPSLNRWPTINYPLLKLANLSQSERYVHTVWFFCRLVVRLLCVYCVEFNCNTYKYIHHRSIIYIHIIQSNAFAHGKCAVVTYKNRNRSFL